MKILEFEQRSPEWFSARCGIPTASGFDKIVTSTGAQSKQRTKYMWQLAGERICKIAEESYQNAAMLRGIETEAEAKNFYEFTTGETVQPVGFCLSDCGTFGASPDGLVGEDGIIEIKCPMLATCVGYLLDGTLPTEYYQQTQGQLLVTGRKWSDFISYYPGIRPLLIRVNRDEEFISKLAAELKLFTEELTQIVSRIS